jgi:hypothetical protein
MKDVVEKGCPPGIEALDMTSMEVWTFTIAVLGDETVYRVSLFFIRSKQAAVALGYLTNWIQSWDTETSC